MARDKELGKKAEEMTPISENQVRDINQDIRILDAIARAFGKKPDKQDPH
jgi:hypothetical protein